MWGSAGISALTGDAGNDTLHSGAGTTYFVFDGSWDADTILDFKDGSGNGTQDFIHMGWMPLVSYDDLDKQNDGTDTVITYNDNSIRIVGGASMDIDASDFVFAV